MGFFWGGVRSLPCGEGGGCQEWKAEGLCFYWFPSCKMYGTGFSLLLHLQDVSNRWPIRVALRSQGSVGGMSGFSPPGPTTLSASRLPSGPPVFIWVPSSLLPFRNIPVKPASSPRRQCVYSQH